MIARVPLNGPGEAEEVAAASLYFASDESRFTAHRRRSQAHLSLPPNFKINRKE
jgi:hypothetical protein